MKKSRFSPAQIAGILKEFDNGKKVEEITREHGISRTVARMCLFHLPLS
jgi:putative transposase